MNDYNENETKPVLFETQDGVKIYDGDIAYWCGYRFGKWLYFDGIKAFSRQADLLVKDNKVFSTSELAKEFVSKSNEVVCLTTWNNLPEIGNHEYFLFYSVLSERESHYITVVVLHIEGKTIHFDYSKTIKLYEVWKVNLDKQISKRINELSTYFSNCVIAT
jgi:hypothetical protein